MADAPVHEMSRECANLLLLAAEKGEAVEEAQLREELGVGHDDLRKILDQLREMGRAVEVTPGEWSGPDVDPQPLEVQAPAVESDDPPASDGSGWGGIAAASGRVEFESALAGPTVRLTRAIADALDENALGQIVKAGLTDEDGVFVLEIVP